MVRSSDSNVGDWIYDTHTGEVFEIVSKKVDIFTDWYEIVLKLDTRDKSVIHVDSYKRSINTASLQTYFIPAKTAQVLYTKRV